MVLGQALTYLVMLSSNIASRLNNMVIAMFEGLLWLTKLEEKKLICIGSQPIFYKLQFSLEKLVVCSPIICGFSELVKRSYIFKNDLISLIFYLTCKC